MWVKERKKDNKNWRRLRLHDRCLLGGRCWKARIRNRHSSIAWCLPAYSTYCLVSIHAHINSLAMAMHNKIALDLLGRFSCPGASEVLKLPFPHSTCSERQPNSFCTRNPTRQAIETYLLKQIDCFILHVWSSHQNRTKVATGIDWHEALTVIITRSRNPLAVPLVALAY